ncbi:Heart- and neural crest derivatives-expressed protein 2 [Chamberlinius hualienensis]
MSLMSGFTQNIYHHPLHHHSHSHHHHHRGMVFSNSTVNDASTAANYSTYYPQSNASSADATANSATPYYWSSTTLDSAPPLSTAAFNSYNSVGNISDNPSNTNGCNTNSSNTNDLLNPNCPPPVRGVKRRVTANKKERRRTLSINTAFSDLRDCIPNVPSDTKLSKIKTLRLATSYISYLMDILAKDDPNCIPEGGFKADVCKKVDNRDERKKKEMVSLLGSTVSSVNSIAVGVHVEAKKSKGRTGWPQHVWALELKQ